MVVGLSYRRTPNGEGVEDLIAVIKELDKILTYDVSLAIQSDGDEYLIIVLCDTDKHKQEIRNIIGQRMDRLFEQYDGEFDRTHI